MGTESSEKLSEACANILQALSRAIDFVIRFAGGQGIGDAFPQWLFQLRYLKPDSPTRATVVTEDRVTRSFASFYFSRRSELDTSESIAALNTMCKSFKNTFGVAMEKYWMNDYGRVMLFRYFERVGRFVLDPSVAAAVVDEFSRDLTASREQIELVYYVEGLIADSPFTLFDGKVSFAPMSDDDLVKYSEQSAMFVGPRIPYLNIADWTCRIITEGDKRTFDDLNRASDILDVVLNAIFLTSEGNARFSLLSKQVTNTFLPVGRISGEEPLNSGRGGPIHLKASDIAKLDNVLHRVNRVSTDERLKLLRHPLRRMRVAASRRSAADAFLDTVVALEGLLAHDTPALESTYRFRLRGAALLSDQFGSPRQRLISLRDMYSMRSHIVHGENVDATLDPLLKQGSLILKFIFLRYLEFSEVIEPEDVIRRVDEWMVNQPCVVPVA